MISVVIIAKNEEKKIGECLESVAWADEIILVDTGSTDKTVEIAKKYKAKAYECIGGSYDRWRNEGLRRAKGEWILYLDADERVIPELRLEIEKLIIRHQSSVVSCYAIPRKNIILGKFMKHGGWWPDYVKRLFLKGKLERWVGKLHEEPVYQGGLGYLKNPLVHLKYDKLSEMVEKTNNWSEVEAKLLFDSGHPPMVWWRFLRIMLSELWLRLIIKKGFLDGIRGVIYALYQVWSRFLTYAKLWELQKQKL